jgi:hypothetical protein
MSGIVTSGREPTKEHYRKIVEDRIAEIKELIDKAEEFVKSAVREVKLLEVALKIFEDDDERIKDLANIITKKN